MNDRPQRRELMRPVQLLALAFGAAVFAFVVTLVAMGFFQAIPASSVQRAVVVALIIGGSVFVVTLVVIALLILAIDPAQVTKTIDRAVLLPPEDDEKPDPDSSDRRP